MTGSTLLATVALPQAALAGEVRDSITLEPVAFAEVTVAHAEAADPGISSVRADRHGVFVLRAGAARRPVPGRREGTRVRSLGAGAGVDAQRCLDGAALADSERSGGPCGGWWTGWGSTFTLAGRLRDRLACNGDDAAGARVGRA